MYADLLINQPLDRETLAVHNLILRAVDCGTPALSGTINITVTVLDANDNAPKFDKHNYEVNVPENALLGTTCIKLNATDADEGSNAELLYSFTLHTSEEARKRFSVDQRTGEIKVIDLLDFELSRQYELFVQAKDNGYKQMTGQCKVVVKINDCNDNQPEITVTSLKSSVLEDVPIGTVIALFSVTDLDFGDNGMVNCGISDNTHFTLQQTVENYYALVTAELLDRELIPGFNITIIVKDKGIPSLSNNESVYLTLLDVNDNAPSFSHVSYEIPVSENNLPGTRICSITANDPDKDQNGVVKYSIQELNNFNNTVTKLFSINQDSGNIYALQSFDFEKEIFYTFTVLARDSGSPQLSSSASVTVRILDENDNTPVIVSPWRSHGSIVSDTIPNSPEEGYLVVKVIAIDDDSMQNSRITYHLLHVTDQTLFTLNQYTGELRTRRRFVFRDASKQRLVIQARDNGSPSLSSTVTILISRSDPEDEGRLTLNDDLETEYLIPFNMYLMIGLVSVSFSFLLTIVISRTMEIYTLQSFDCEKRTFYTFNIVVEILDVNDNAPRFPFTVRRINISEAKLKGDRFLLVKAVDPDIGNNSVCNYKLSENLYFEIAVKTWKDGSVSADLLIKEALDREQLAEHNLILTALDCGKPALSGTINITVAILDDNDNAPIFEREVYHVEVSEKTLTGTTFITLNATDADEGSNAELFYSFNPHTSEEAQMKFRLNSRTGDLIVNEPLDFEEAPLYELFVQASDNGPNPMTGHCKVIIKVVDSNDNQPEIIVASSQSSVSEDVPIGTVIALFSVTDLDSGNNGRVNCHISSNNEFELQQTMDNVYALVTAELLDRERKSSFNITIVVKDEGTPPLANNKTICLNVLDVNDNAPSFSRASYEIPVPENNIPGTLLCSITAVDPDANLNGVLKYYIEEKNYSNNTFMNFFSINRDNGNIYSLQSFDYEKQTFFTFNVIAKDSGTPQLSNSVTVKITVLDENDNIPVIVSPWRPHGSIVSDIIPRSAEEGYLVTKVIAIDDDSVQNSRITYHLLQVTDQTLFTLNQYSGELRTRRRFGVRDSSKQRLVIQARDNGNPSLSSTVTILISRSDPEVDVLLTINDEEETEYVSALNIYLMIGATFVTLNATDADEGLNAELLYSFNPHTSEKAQMKFRLNSRTGELSVNELLDFEQFPLYELFVQAKDFGPNPLTGHCKVIIKVVDSNDNRPEIIVASSQGSVSEDVPIGTVLALFSVTDLDSGNNGRVNCHISDNVEFELQQTMDNVYALVTAKLLDRERKPSFNITIIVKDEGTPPLTNNKTIFLNVLDVNDNAPFFSRALYEIPIAENNIPGSLLCSITAKDPDADLNGALKYSIKETNDSNSFTNYFSINRDNGNIYSLQSFDYEQQTFYTFNVVAKDSGALQLSSSVTINITVLDENDNTPVIVSPWRPHGSIVSDTIPSSADEGYLVTKVIAIDDDSVQNSRITYHLLQVTDQTLFTLNQHSGELRTRRRFGFRDSSKQRLVIQARDNGNPSLSSTVTILISRSDPEVESLLAVNDELETEHLSSLNIYLMIGLASASFLFLLTIVMCAALKCHRNSPEDSEKSAHRISCYSQRDSMISDLPAHSTLYSSDAYWHSVLLAESRKGKMLVRQSMPNGTGFIVSSLERNPEQGTISELADTPIQVRFSQKICCLFML
uniref:Cadherin domain-containing protein n=1 Tax=Erpetoichthys calabaricus TaxID=27687 RepID=A0A8C4SGC7_ERPCA